MNNIHPRHLVPLTLLCLGVFVHTQAQPLQAQSAPPAAKKSARVLELEREIQERLDRIKTSETIIADADDRSRLLQDKIELLKQEETKMSVSSESYPEVLKTLHSQRVQLLIDLAGIEARHKAIEEAIDRVRFETSAKIDDSLKRLLAIRERDLERLRQLHANGTVSMNEISKAEVALLEAKTRVAQLKEPSDGMLDHLNGQLLDTSLEKAEKTARLSKANMLIDEVDAYRMHADKISRARQQLNGLSITKRAAQQDAERDAKIISRTRERIKASTNLERL